jgi:hypothetical protein
LQREAKTHDKQANAHIYTQSTALSDYAGLVPAKTPLKPNPKPYQIWRRRGEKDGEILMDIR